MFAATESLNIRTSSRCGACGAAVQPALPSPCAQHAHARLGTAGRHRPDHRGWPGCAQATTLPVSLPTQPSAVSSASSTDRGASTSGRGIGSSYRGSEPALRPRRFSAPELARAIRSTLTLAELASLVAQQSSSFDNAHISIAMAHMALLVGKQQQQQQQQQQRDQAASRAAAHTGSAAGSSPRALAASSSQDWMDNDGIQPLMLGDIGDDDDAGPSPSTSGTNGSAKPAANGFLSSSIAANGSNGSSSSNGSSGKGNGVALASLEAAEEEAASLLLDTSTSESILLTRCPDPNTDSDMLLLADSGQGTNGTSSGFTAQAQQQAGRNGASQGPAAGAAQGPPAVQPGAGAPAPSRVNPPAASSSSLAAGGVLRVVLPLVFARLDQLGGSDLACVLSALGALRYGDRVVSDSLLQATAPKLYDCKPQDLANIMCAAALMGVPTDIYFRTAFYAAVKTQAKRFGPRELALTLWAYGAGGTDVAADAVAVLLEACRGPRGLTAMGPGQLAKVAQGLAALRYRPPNDWVDAFGDVLRPALRRMSQTELCALLQALASLQLALDERTRAAVLLHTLSSPDVLPSMPPTQLALAIWSLGRLSSAPSAAPAAPASPSGPRPPVPRAAAPVPPPALLLDLDTSGRVLDLTYATMGAFSAGELQLLLEGLTRLALQPPLEWMQRLVEALRPQLAGLQARQLAGILGSLAAQQYRPSPEVQEVVLAATQANMKQLLADTTATAALVTALRRLSIEPPPSWVAALLDASRSAINTRASDLHLANLAASLAAWGVKPDGRWTARLFWRSQNLILEGRMSPRALVALLQAMVELGVRPNPRWTRLCLRAAAAQSSSPYFEAHHYGTLMASLHALRIRPQQEWLMRMLLSTYRCWTSLGVTQWCSLLPALVLLEARPPREWLRRLEASTGPRLADCSALQLLTLLVSLTQLHALQQQGAPAPLASPLKLPPAAGPAGAAAAAGPTAASAGPSARPGSEWLAAWWAASTRQLQRVRYAPSELALTADWLASLGLRPTAEWMQACADVASRYSKVLSADDQQQLAAAITPLITGEIPVRRNLPQQPQQQKQQEKKKQEQKKRKWKQKRRQQQQTGEGSTAAAAPKPTA